jgi:hypothetical protein
MPNKGVKPEAAGFAKNSSSAARPASFALPFAHRCRTSFGLRFLSRLPVRPAPLRTFGFCHPQRELLW